MSLLLLALLLTQVPQQVIIVDPSTRPATGTGSTAAPIKVTCVSGCSAGGSSSTGNVIVDGGQVDIGVVKSTVIVVVDGGVIYAIQPTAAALNATVVGTVTANAGSGTMAVSGPLTDTQLRAAVVPVSLTSTTLTGTSAISAASLPLPTGAATETTLGTRVADATITARLAVLGQGTMAASAPVVIASNQSAIPTTLTSTTITGTVAATQSGTWTVQPGNTANTTAWKVDGSAVTQPVSGTVTANAGTNLNTSALALSAAQTDRTQKTQVTDGTRDGTVKAASTAAVAADTALVVAISPNNTVPVSLTSTTVTGTVANNVTQFGGTNVSTGTGAGGAGIPRVTVSSDSSLAANQSVNTNQLAGNTISTGVGASGTGTARVAALIHDGTSTAKVTAASTAAVTADPALVVRIPSVAASVNIPATISPVLVGGSDDNGAAQFLKTTTGGRLYNVPQADTQYAQFQANISATGTTAVQNLPCSQVDININVAGAVTGAGANMNVTVRDTAVDDTTRLVGATFTCNATITATGVYQCSYLTRSSNIAITYTLTGTTPVFNTTTISTTCHNDSNTAFTVTATAAPTYTTGTSNPLSTTTIGSVRSDIASIVGVAASTGVGASGTGTLRTASLIHDGTTTAGVIVGTTALKTDMSSIAGTATVTGGVAGVQAVGGNVANAVAATANPVPVGGIFTTAPATLTTGQTATMQFTAAQNLKHDLTTVGGTAVSTGAGAGGAGIMRVTVSNDSSLAANQSVNVAQINGVAPLMGTGATGTGSHRVTLATNSPGYSTANGTIAVDSSLEASRAVAYGSSPTAVTAGNQAPRVGDLEGRPYVNTSHPRTVMGDFANASTATLLELTGTAAVASNSYYISSWTTCGGVATAVTVPALLRSGTGTNCGTGTVTLASCFHVAQSCCTMVFPNPIKATAGHAICMIDATVGNKTATVTGYVAP